LAFGSIRKANYAQNAKFAIYPPKWLAGSTGETAELTFSCRGWFG
jgi:hypothetical protein